VRSEYLEFKDIKENFYDIFLQSEYSLRGYVKRKISWRKLIWWSAFLINLLSILKENTGNELF